METTIKLTVSMTDLNGSKTTKSFNNIGSAVTDSQLKALANSYAALTTSIATTAKKGETTPIDLN